MKIAAILVKYNHLLALDNSIRGQNFDCIVFLIIFWHEIISLNANLTIN
jgi:hypothetical protein